GAVRRSARRRMHHRQLTAAESADRCLGSADRELPACLRESAWLHSIYFASSMSHEIVDITIIGGGPTGLFASFYTGMRGATARIVDALPQLGGQLTALYPEKYIFDVGGFAKILAKDLVKQLAEQANQFKPAIHLNQRVTGLEREGNQFVLVT